MRSLHSVMVLHAIGNLPVEITMSNVPFVASSKAETCAALTSIAGIAEYDCGSPAGWHGSHPQKARGRSRPLSARCAAACPAATICTSTRTGAQELVKNARRSFGDDPPNRAGSRSLPRCGGAKGRAGLDAAANCKVRTTASTSFNAAVIRSDRSVGLAQVSDGLPADRRR
jgi:hypothetical protein